MSFLPPPRVACFCVSGDVQFANRDCVIGCVICYNDYGVPNPEGINEAPLRLPKCKHVFGDHCIKKWFEESDSCPYCRDKVPSESYYTRNPQSVQSFWQHQLTSGRSNGR